MSETEAFLHCPRCKEDKPASGYHRHGATRTGRQGICKPCAAEDQRRRKAGLTPIELRARWIWGKYKLPADTWLGMLAGGCRICGISDEDAAIGLVVDHDHTCCPGSKSCGECVRGVLCFNCNTALGHFRDSPTLLASAIEYLTLPESAN